MRALAGLVLAGLLTACATPPPVASIQVPVPCVKERPVPPAFVTDAELRAMNDYQLGLALFRYRLQAGGYIGELEAVVDGCARLAPMK